jgi:hypothetical protein
MSKILNKETLNGVSLYINKKCLQVKSHTETFSGTYKITNTAPLTVSASQFIHRDKLWAT